MEQNEVHTYKEAMIQEDAKDFIQDMLKEIGDHKSRGHWTMIQRGDMPINAKTILSIWSFKRKRHPDGRLNKHKARICAHGGMQKWGVDYWETYSPVVNWISVRALLTISKIHNLPTKSIDFFLAFPQAELDMDVFMEIPAGFSSDLRKTHVLKLNKSLYVKSKQASSNWYKHLTTALKRRLLSQSNNDNYIFFKEGLIVLVYVDDCIIIGKTNSDIRKFVDSLKSGEENFDFTEEGSLEQYLGVGIKKISSNSLK
jgi:Reverse transcriptase (RNA-dependent DNA polymerase).